MPVNFQEVQKQVRKMGEQAPQREKTLQEQRQRARRLLKANSQEIIYLRRLVEHALARNSSLRCAVPVSELLMASFDPLSTPPAHVLFAADGSQINPDRQAAVEFAVVNVGVIRMNPHQPQAPREIIQTHLLYGDKVDLPQGMLTEEQVMWMRDLRERRALVELASLEPPPVLTLTDGPLELFRETMDQRNQMELQEYIAELAQLASMQVLTAGYVDKPRANLVVRLLELLEVKEDELGVVGQRRPLHGVNDADLFFDLLQPNQRSAVFALQSSASRSFSGPVALHFFYLNVGREDHPALARVEIPAWVAESQEELALLHTALVEQCAQLGSRPYPYALHRAHEIAVVGPEEKQHLEAMIALELRSRGMAVGNVSNKQAAKDISGKRGRFEIR